MDTSLELKSTHVYTEQIYSGFAHSCKRRMQRDIRISEPPPPPPEHRSPSATPALNSPAAPPYIRRNRSTVHSSRCSITSNPGPPSGSPDSPMSLGSRTCTRTLPAVCSTLTVEVKQKLGSRKKVKDWDWDWDRFCVVLRLHPKLGVSVSGSFHVHFRDSMKASSWELSLLVKSQFGNSVS
uniref:Uncharacterized protein n=1 Tax=Cucumis sativus TaxID=3659 RepID=A0A0A0LWS9_CUCSA